MMYDYDILVIGEYGIDEFITGDVERLSPEGPIPILKVENKESNTTSSPGMAWNTYLNLMTLNPELQIKILSQDKPIKKTRFVDEDSGYILLRLDEDDFVTINNEDFCKSVLYQINQNKKSLKAVVISDYNKGLLSIEGIESIISSCNELGILTFLDTKKILGKWSEKIDFVKINEREFDQNLEFKLNFEIVQKIKNYPCKSLIVTLGKKGSICNDRNTGKVIDMPLEKIVEIKDVAGAGDTYLAAFVTEYLKTKNITKSMKFANRASTVAVSKPGVVTVSKQDIDKMFKNE